MRRRDLLQRLGMAFVFGVTAEELKSLATELFAKHLASIPLETAIRYVSENRSAVMEVWQRLKPQVKNGVRKVVKMLPPKVLNEVFSPKTVADVLVRSGRTDLASLFINDPRAKQWLLREIELAKRLVLGES